VVPKFVPDNIGLLRRNAWMPLANSSVTDGRARGRGKLIVKTGPLWLTFWYLAFFRLLFSCVSRGVFCFLSYSINIHNIQIHYHFLTFFGVLASGPPTLTSEPPSAKLCPLWLKPPVTPLLANPGWKTQVYVKLVIWCDFGHDKGLCLIFINFVEKTLKS